jgi:hypothetical protein
MDILRYCGKLLLASLITAAFVWPVVCSVDKLPQYSYLTGYALLGAILLSLLLYTEWGRVPALAARGARAARPHVVRGARGAGNGVAAGTRFSWPYLKAAGKWLISSITAIFREVLHFCGGVLGFRYGLQAAFAGWFILFASLGTVLYGSTRLGRTLLYVGDIRVTYGMLFGIVSIGAALSALGFFLSLGGPWVKEYRRWEAPIRRRLRTGWRSFSI